MCVRRNVLILTFLFRVWFSRSNDTVLGETGDSSELFVSEDCDNNPLGSVMGKVNVSSLMVSLLSCICVIIN